MYISVYIISCLPSILYKLILKRNSGMRISHGISLGITDASVSETLMKLN